MATINKYTFNKNDAIVSTTLTGADSVTLVQNKTSVLIVENSGASPVTLSVLGDGVTSVTCSGVGTIDLSGGLGLAVPNGTTQKFQLNPARSAYMGDSLVNITGGTTDLKAYVIES